MFEFLRGQLIDASATTAVLDIRGVGYKLSIPAHLLGKITVNQEITFYTSLIVREDAHTLYGFIDRKERELFEKLITISGIGPKTALNIIGHLPLPLFLQGIQNNQIATFTKVPGIGKKTAERLLLELRGKFPLTFENCSSKASDALSALLTLGYSQQAAHLAVDKALKDLPAESDLSTLISHALKNRL